MTDTPSTPEHARPAKRRKTLGLKPVVWLTGAGLVALAITNEFQFPAGHGSLWRVLVGIVAFLYLWWLSALLFDLVFVWHRYIQSDVAHEFLRAHVQRKDLSSIKDPPEKPPEPGIRGVRPTVPAGGGVTTTPAVQATPEIKDAATQQSGEEVSADS